MAGAGAGIGTCALAAVLVFAGAAQAETFTPAPNASYGLDLDTQAGAVSQWRIGDLTGLNALRGRANFWRKGSDRQWSPQFSVAVGDDAGQAWLQITALPHSGPLIARVFRLQGGAEADVQYFSIAPQFREPFDVKADWSPDGRVAFSISARATEPIDEWGRRGTAPVWERREIHLGRAPVWLQIQNRTGEVMIDPLQLGQAAP